MTAATGGEARVEHVSELKPAEIEDLSESATSAILEGGGFGWLEPPPRETLEAFWRGVLVVPERELVVARLDGRICGSVQLVSPPRNNEAQKFQATVQGAFVAPWARGHGLATMLMVEIERVARGRRLRVLNLDVRETQATAIQLYGRLGYQHWATHPRYAWVRGEWVSGLFFTKDLDVTELPGTP